MKLRQNNEINNIFLYEQNDLKSFNNRVNTINNNINELFQKYKTVRKKRKIEEEKERQLTNRLKHLISKETKISKKKEKEKEKEKRREKQMDLLEKSKYNKYTTHKNGHIYNDIENKENFADNIKKVMLHNNSVKIINSLVFNECNDIISKLKSNEERNKSGFYKLFDNNNFRTINSNNKIKYISNNVDKSFNCNDNFKKDLLYHKKIIQNVSNAKKMKFSYNYNHIKENSFNTINNNTYKRKKNNPIPNIKKSKIYKKANDIKKEEIKKDNNIEINNIYKDKERMEIFEKNYNKIINNVNSPNIKNYWKEKEKEKEKERNRKSKEEEKSKIKEINIKDLGVKDTHKKINTYSMLCHSLTKDDWKSKINLHKKNYSKSPKKYEYKKLPDNRNNVEKTNIYILEKIENSPVKEEEEEKSNENSINLYYYTMKNNIIKNESENNMKHYKTIDCSQNSPNRNKNKKFFRNKNLSFNKSIEDKRIILGLNHNKKKNNKKYYNFEEEIKITEHILSYNNSTKKYKYEISKTHNPKDNISKKRIKVTKAGHLINLGDKSIYDNKKKIKYNKTTFNILFKKVLSANSSLESYENICNNDRIKNLSYKKLMTDRSQKKESYNENKKFDFYLTDKNFYSARRKESNMF